MENKKNITDKYPSSRPLKMYPMPKYDKMIVDRDARFDYLLIPITEELTSEIRKKFMTEENGFVLRTNGYVIDSDSILSFGKPLENDAIAERKLENIIKSKDTLAIPSPIDEKNLKVGNRINTAASRYQAYRYYVCLIGKPDYVLLFKNARNNKG